MKLSQLVCGGVDARDLFLNRSELSRRLGCPSESVSSFSSCLNELLNTVKPKFVCRFERIRADGDNIDVGFGGMISKNLAKNLEGCEVACLFAVTLGIECDRMISRRAKISAAEGFASDAIASALAESLCDKAETLILEGRRARPRFSIGYGDLSLEYQRPFLDLLMAEKTVGITLSEGYLMIPTKSITAIAGVL